VICSSESRVDLQLFITIAVRASNPRAFERCKEEAIVVPVMIITLVLSTCGLPNTRVDTKSTK
jgi:hypothetical protein